MSESKGSNFGGTVDGPVPRAQQHILMGKGAPGAPQNDQIRTTRVGLRFPRNVTFESWQQAGVQVSRVVDSFAWCLGDWLVFGRRQYADRYRQAIDAAGLDYQTLRNYAWIANRFELTRRRPKLSFQHHAELASLPEDQQDYWLDRAEEGRWSRNQLRQYVRASRNGRSPAEAGSAVLPKLQVDSNRVLRWREAATQSSLDFEAWVVEALDRAADSMLNALRE
ncbi:LmbU family transcriptional regulator [Nocardia sp. NPDC051911]|uniref:LmbU family transcriptional regulator n=1 Tax=Nocardia sp. NPDC051911 TaxID=3154648 RepID=UPI00343478FE